MTRSVRSLRSRLPATLGLTGGIVFATASPSIALGHGEVPSEAPTAGTLILGWSAEPAIVIPLIVVAVAWTWAVRRVNAAHRASPVPARRSAFFLAGLGAIAVALLSGIERYDTTLFSVHMVQHLLLALVAAPLIVLGAPVTLALRLASPETRRALILPLLHSRVLRAITHPVVAWLVFAGVMWGTHFSTLFDAALEDRLLHDFEHGLYLGAGLLFWWPAVAADPAPRRLGHPVRILYVLLQMPQNTFLAVVLLNAAAPLYPHYATLERDWGPSALEDQQLAAGIMWLGGDILFLAAVFALIASWMRAEERSTAASDRRSDLARIAIDERSERMAAERSEMLPADRLTPEPPAAEPPAAGPPTAEDAGVSRVEQGPATPAAADSVPDPRSRR